MVFSYCCPCPIRSRGAIEGNFLLVRWTIVHIGQPAAIYYSTMLAGPNEEVWIFTITPPQQARPVAVTHGGAQPKGPLTEKTHLRISNTNSPVEAEERKLQRRIFTPNGALLTAAKVPPHAQWEGGRLSSLWKGPYLFELCSIFDIQVPFVYKINCWKKF